MDNQRPPDPDLLLAHARFVRQTAHALLGGDDRVNDVVQDTFMAALTNGPRSPASVRGWLAGVVRNLAFTIRRRDTSRGRREAVAAQRKRALPRPEAFAEREEARRRMVSAVLSLREPYRTAVLLRYYEDLPPREIAVILDVPVETARTRVRRGLALLREEMERGQRGRSGTWTGVVALLVPGARLEPVLAGGTVAAGAAAGGVVVGTKLKLGLAIVIVVLLCVGTAQWQSGDAPDQPEVLGPGRNTVEGDAAPTMASPSPKADPVAGAPTPGPADPSPARGETGGAKAPRMWRSGPIGTVRGKVEITGSGESVRGVEVLLEPDFGPGTGGAGQKKVRTAADDEGGFSFEDLKPGIYRVTFLHPDTAHRSLAGIRIDGRGGIQGLVALVSTDSDTFGSVEGQATGPDRLPLANRVVVVHSHKPAVFVETVTDESGHYRVDRLLGGHYFVSLLGEKASLPETAARGSEGLWSRFIVAEIKPREATQTDFIGYGTLSGVVVDGEDRPLAGLAIEISPVVREGEIVVRKGQTDAEGRFRIENAGLGAHHLRVHHKKEGWTITAETLALTGNDQQTRVRLASGAIDGTVMLAEENVPPSKEKLYPAILLFPHTPGREGSGAAHIAVAYPDWKGKLRVRGIPPGRYRLSVALKGYVHWEKIVDLEPGKKLSGIEIALRRLRVGTLKARVRDEDGRPVDGMFLKYGTPGGKYRSLGAERPEPGVYIGRKIEIGEWTVVAARSGLKSAGAKVRVTEGEVTEVVLTVEPE